MAISREEVEHVARLARLGLSEEEKDRFTVQLGRILEHVAALQRLDTEGVPPTFHVLPLQNVLRADEVLPSLPREEALARAPETGEGTFRVPKITEG
ncbi:Asp-tRNA(Asn)/Glu-tRNA(Gln) amidotransferase subunit GatC [Caldinitratiruptor microaerophilus]|uniref:Aspartyl/glutamyl-tRNA(Asn/Gln) amidotransferase subunit C n=1 Tax=Caldinitratiruptor microaerophilus TaxID=671077 RepID=A0AA35GAF6_9FIRM|nr:Asp-tRNA(Asn)/Glu-tRNA(Gln) amidotransferase subunit GatC [Caldinitratiruptor microaerophilus]BDG61249.1 aspartyl/glutamyl-tRNA(Asn/Gln) amidotransferase subunit C [Caldinitratiruptor microaerophilus]